MGAIDFESMAMGINREAPGALGEFMDEIAKNFERRNDGERYRLTGALGLTQAMAGRYLIGPTGSICNTGIFLVARSGAGKGAPVSFVRAYSNALGIGSRVCASKSTSTKQMQLDLIAGGGSLLYVVNDDKQHLEDWNNPRNAYLGGTMAWYRGLTDGGVWVPNRPIIKELLENLTWEQNPKRIMAAASAEGWIVPLTGGDDGKGVIDYKRLAMMDHSVGRALKSAMNEYEIATKDGGIENAKFVPLITVTPEQGIDAARSWQKDGGMGRVLFQLGHLAGEEMPEMKDVEVSGTLSRKIINEWKGRILTAKTHAVWADDDVKKLHRSLSMKLESELGDRDGVVGDVIPRMGLMILDLATLAAYADLSSRRGMTPAVTMEHVEWGYIVVLEHLAGLQRFLEGEQEFDGLENTEWENIVEKIKRICESQAFIKTPYLSVIKNKLCRDRIKKIINSADSNNITLTPDKFVYEVLLAIEENKHSPLMLDRDNPRAIKMCSDGSWDGLRMNSTVRNYLSAAVKRMRFMSGLK